MSFQPRNILFFGATGNIGKHILAGVLSARDEFDRVAIFTSPATAQSKAAFLDDLKASKRVEVIVGDIKDEEAVKKAYEGLSFVFFFYPAPLMHIHKASHFTE